MKSIAYTLALPFLVLAALLILAGGLIGVPILMALPEQAND